MKKKILALCLTLGFSGALAEESGVFVGIGGNFQAANKKVTDTDYTSSVVGNNPNQSVSITMTAQSKTKENKLNGGASVLLGYKHMLDESSGVRAYLNYDYNVIKLTKENAESETAHYQIVGFNADYLYNFSEGLGVFIGANFGAIKWDKNLHNDSNQWDMYFAPQLGLRTILGGRHSFELFAKFPLMNETKIRESNPQQLTVNNQQVTVYNHKNEINLKQNYNLGLRYIFTF